jgi:hypothetical protein
MSHWREDRDVPMRSAARLRGRAGKQSRPPWPRFDSDARRKARYRAERRRRRPADP